MSLHRMSLAELSRAIAAAEITPLELTRHFLDRIERLDPKLHAFRIVDRAGALERAAFLTESLTSQARSDRPRPSPLFGIPYAAKDLFDVVGMTTGAGSRLLEEHVATSDAAAIRRLNNAGMILLGKTHTVQLAYGGAGVNHDCGTPHNPWHPVHHLPGGSSSGSAVAVAAGMAPAALGTDTGGSVRIPASLCGITGLKTTVGRVSRAGVYPLSWSLDSVGPLCRSAADAALVYEAIAGPDDADTTTWGRPAEEVSSALGAGIEGFRLAFAEGVFWRDTDPEVEAAVRECGNVLRNLGAEVSSFELAEAELALELNPRGLVIAAEAYALNRQLLEEHLDELDPIVSTRMVHGREVEAQEYLSTVAAWQRLRVETRRSLAEVDAVLCPTSAIPALPLHEVDADLDTYSRANVLYLRNTAIGNILDLSAVSVPCSWTRAGLPIGLMIYGKAFDERKVLQVANAFQQATGWHRRSPNLTWAES